MNAKQIKHIIHTLKDFYPCERDFIPLHEPEFMGNEWDYVKECLDSGWVSSVGQYVGAFEKKLAELTSIKHAVAVVNGTAALHIALKVIGVTNDDEVLIPTLTFVATANAVAYCQAIPHLIDSDYETLGVNCEKLADYLEDIAEMGDGVCYNKHTGRRIKAIIPMHTFGHPVKMDVLQRLCEAYQITIVEDAAESLGSFYQSQHTGSWGKLTAVSFNGNKIVTCGGGGAILTNDESLAKTVRHLTTTAKVPHSWRFIHDSVAYNYRLPNINAALGLAQLEQLEYKLKCKRALAKAYQEAFSENDECKFYTEPFEAQSNYWFNALILNKDSVIDTVLEETNANGIMTRPFWDPMHKLEMYKDCPQMDLSIAEDLFKRLINIPSSAWIGEPYV
ncbi:LegC family aminotransferase [Legionella sp. W05-934-2]|uniref:LegC family aminotransferase n=1 Tax=Legionella sp. W05-934-2 TaxID=1198649 RepID=UPI0034628949